MNINVQRKVSSVLRRKIPFVGFSCNPPFKTITVIQSFNSYRKQIQELQQIGICRRSERTINLCLQVNGLFYDIVLISYGDVRENKLIYGQNPLAGYFGICMFDYVFMFVVRPDQTIQEQSFNALNQQGH